MGFLILTALLLLQAGPSALPPDEAIGIVRMQMFFTGLTLAFGLLHLILFAILPRSRSNLYYALFLFFYAAAIFFDFQATLWTYREIGLQMLSVQRIVLSLSLIFGVRFFFALFRPHPPRWFALLALSLIGAGLVAATDPVARVWVLEIPMILALLVCLHIVYQAIRIQQQDAWIIALGLGMLAVFALYDIGLDFGLFGPIGGLDNAYQFGSMGLFVATSTYLARDIARTNQQLVKRERHIQQHRLERQLLEADVARKTRELEDARALQLSMLPTTLPDLPHLDLAVHMQTATEVGGDYYDYHYADDGTLTLAIGDATGHGTKAGIMVAIAKSLFRSAAVDGDLRCFFHDATRVLKQMQLGNLFMALTLVRLRGSALVASAAGMPPFLIYRAATGAVETITLKGMPLGAFHDFPYQQAQTRLASGDAVLFLTDGFTELFNEDKEMFGLERARAAFQEAATEPAEAILTHLRTTCRAWSGTRPPDDDITLFVLKMTDKADVSRDA